MNFETVLQFWFVEHGPKDWWKKDSEFDQLIADRFGDIHTRASRCELAHWRVHSEGRLAEILILDQFSRNIYRDKAEAFAQDALALALAQEAIANQADGELPAIQKQFVYLPFMHSESLVIHEQAVELFSQPGLDNLDFELKHKAIIERFGRYPHRNAVLGRKSTEEELEFLQQPGSSF